jgi:hypothetical protein
MLPLRKSWDESSWREALRTKTVLPAVAVAVEVAEAVEVAPGAKSQPIRQPS